MPIPVTCECGKSIEVPDHFAGKAGKCPACGRVVRVPLVQADIGMAEPPPVYAAQHLGDTAVAPPRVLPPHPLNYVAPGMGPGGPIAPPPSDVIRLPTMLPEKLRQPNCPPVFLVFSTAGTDIHADFDASLVLQTFAEAFGWRLKKKFEVHLEPPPPQGGAMIAFVRVVRIDQGNRWLRYFLGLLAALFGAATCFEVDGHVQGPSGAPMPFNIKHRCFMGLFGGSSLNLLKVNAKVVAKKVAACVKKAR